MGKRLQDLLARYGAIALTTYFVVFALVLGGFTAAIALGFDVRSAGAGLGTLGAAYVATKMTQPLRIAATVVLTPLVARALTALGHRREHEQEHEGGAGEAEPRRGGERS